MADTAVAITSGTGTNIDTRTEATNGNHRQVVVLGDPSTNAGVAPVDATAGLKVDLGADNDVTVTGNVEITNDSGNAIPVSMATNTPVGNVAHDAADSGNPIKIGGKAKSTLSGVTLVAADDRTDMYFDLDGVQLVRTDRALGDLVSGNASNTDGTSTSVLAAGAAGVKHYITDVTIANTSSSNIYVELKDNTTVKWTFPVPANGGVTHHFASPLAGTAATAWNFDPSAATTTVYCSVAGFKSKI